MYIGKKLAQVSIATSCAYLTQKTADNLFVLGKKEEEPQNTSMLLWGNGYYQARPDFKKQFSNFTPKQIAAAKYKGENKVDEDNLPQFTDLKFTDMLAVGLSNDGKIYSFENREILPYKDKSDASMFIKQGDKTYDLDNVLFNLQNLSFKGKAMRIGLTKNFVWSLDEEGNLYQMQLAKLKEDQFKGEWRKITTINNLKDISTGFDHILMLTKKGELFSMGDDTYGQCGIGEMGRLRGGPYAETRVSNPTKVKTLEDRTVDRIYSNGNHNMVILNTNELLGFGSNSFMQLGHSDQYIQSKNPALAFFEPVTFAGYLDTVKCNLQEVALGEDFSIFVCKNRETENTQLFGCGHNLFGQLGNGLIAHTSDFQFMDTLSDFTIPTADQKQVPVEVRQISCGKGHCMALMSLDIVMTWGMNDYGQLGNKKRSFKETPLIVSKLKNKNVEKIVAHHNNSYALVKDYNSGENKNKPQNN